MEKDKAAKDNAEKGKSKKKAKTKGNGKKTHPKKPLLLREYPQVLVLLHILLVVLVPSTELKEGELIEAQPLYKVIGQNGVCNDVITCVDYLQEVTFLQSEGNEGERTDEIPLSFLQSVTGNFDFFIHYIFTPL